MTLPVIWANLTNPNLAGLDQDFAAVALMGMIQGTLAGTNAITISPFANMADPPFIYTNNMTFGGVAVATNTGATTFNGGTGALSVYKDSGSGPVALTGGEIVDGNFVWFIFDQSLDGGLGGFHLAILPAGYSGTVTSIVTGTGLTGGPITATGTISLASAATLTIKANITGGSAAPTDHSLSAIIDACISSTQGAILYRGASAWSALAVGTAGQVLTTGGAAANPSWTTPVVLGSVATALTATGSTQGTALQLSANYNDVATTPASTGVILATTIGVPQTVWNDGALTLNVYPPSGATINAIGTNTADTISAGSYKTYVMITSTQAKIVT